MDSYQQELMVSHAFETVLDKTKTALKVKICSKSGFLIQRHETSVTQIKQDGNYRIEMNMHIVSDKQPRLAHKKFIDLI